jgi:hypothetical protein
MEFYNDVLKEILGHKGEIMIMGIWLSLRGLCNAYFQLIIVMTELFYNTAAEINLERAPSKSNPVIYWIIMAAPGRISPVTFEWWAQISSVKPEARMQ